MTKLVSKNMNVPRLGLWVNILCFFLPSITYTLSAGDYFLPMALFVISAFAGLFSSCHRRKLGALIILAGFLFAFVAFFLLVLWTSELTLAPLSQWFPR
jgi:hypothetical protein